jgi:preprotein translocase subunit SecE
LRFDKSGFIYPRSISTARWAATGSCALKPMENGLFLPLTLENRNLLVSRWNRENVGQLEIRRTGNWKRQAMAAKSNPFTFLQQVRQEVAKVTWPTRRETVVTTIMVFIMILLAAFFFMAVDQVLGFVIGALLNLGS